MRLIITFNNKNVILPEPWVQPGPPEYLCFEPLLDNSTISFSRSTVGNRIVYYTNDLNRGTWTELGNTSITFNIGDKIYCRGAFTDWSHAGSTPKFTLTGSWKASGKLTSLLYTDDTYTTRRTSNVTCGFSQMFKNQTALTDVSELSFGELTNAGASALTDMFYGCTNITSVTCDITSTNGDNWAMQNMFNRCSNLSYISFPNASRSKGYSGFSYNIATNGTFVKKTGASWPNGSSGIPTGWTVIEV